ncbi:hypothetical protein ACHQM5_004342 [Ranunculus cassubicifolius]
MKESETVKDYYSKIKEIVNQMKSYGEKITDSKVVEKILINLTEKYDPIVTAIEHTKELSTLSVTELMGSLEAYEVRLSRHSENSEESAFQSKINLSSQKSQGGSRKSKEFSRGGAKNNQADGRMKKIFPPCGICKKTSHLKKDCWFRGKPQCKNCHIFGHVESECRKKKIHQANYSGEYEEDDQLFYACQAATEEKK